MRAANGWIVAALRTDIHPRFFPTIEDNYTGIGASISKDDGTTWSPIRIIHQARLLSYVNSCRYDKLEYRTLADLTDKTKLAAKESGQLSGDSQSQACPLVFRDGAYIRLRK